MSGIHCIPTETKLYGHAIRSALIPPASILSLDSSDLPTAQDVGDVTARHVCVSHRLPCGSRNRVGPSSVHDVPNERPRGVVVERFLHEAMIRLIDDSSSRKSGESSSVAAGGRDARGVTNGSVVGARFAQRGAIAVNLPFVRHEMVNALFEEPALASLFAQRAGVRDEVI